METHLNAFEECKSKKIFLPNVYVSLADEDRESESWSTFPQLNTDGSTIFIYILFTDAYGQH
jgi:hypothetical protein